METMTIEQQEKIKIYVDKWLRNGYSTTPLDKQKTIESIKWLYELSDMESPYMLFCDSPFQAQLLINILKGTDVGMALLKSNGVRNINSSILYNLREPLVETLWGTLSWGIWDTLRDTLREPIWVNLWVNISCILIDKVEAMFRYDVGGLFNLGDTIFNLRYTTYKTLGRIIEDNLEGNISVNLLNNSIDRLKDKKLSFEEFFSPSLNSSWVGVYDFILNELFPNRASEFSDFNTNCIQLYESTFFIIPFKKLCFISERPTKVELLKNGNRHHLHCDGGPAISFKDGYQVHALNGVIVPKWVAETPRDAIDPKSILMDSYDEFTHTHEIRSEIIKKIGAGNVLKALDCKMVERLTGEELYSRYPIANYVQQGDVLLFPLDERGNEIYELTNFGFYEMDQKTRIRLVNGVYYELYSTELKGVNIKMLRMGNPSVGGEEHIEFVDEDCETIFEAIVFRNYAEVTNDWKSMIKSGKAGLPEKLS